MRTRILIVLLVASSLLACRSRRPAVPELGNVERGRELILLNECYDCHIIPGIDRKPGPGVPTSLAAFAERSSLAHDTVENTRENLERYIQKPKSLYARSTMPGIGDRPKDAQDIAAYLMTLD